MSIARYHGTGIAQPFIREVTVTFRGDTRDELHVDRADGMVVIALTPEEALAMSLADDKRISLDTGRGVITRVTWENVPGGFVPPNSNEIKHLPRATARKRESR